MNIRSRERYVLAVMICLLVGWNYWFPTFLYSTGIVVSGAPDFNRFWMAGWLLLHHENPYNNTLFVYPPTSIPFYALFAFFSLDYATWLWRIAYFGMFTIALLALCFTLESERRSLYVLLAFLLLFTSYPLLILMRLGQSDLLVGSLTVLALAFQRLQHNFASAAVLSIATVLKGPPFLFLIYFVLFRRDAQYLFHFLISILVMVGGSLLVVPIPVYWYYLTNVVPTFSFIFPVEMNQSLIGYVALAGMSKLAQAASLVGYTLFALFAYFVNSRKRAVAFGKTTLSGDTMFLMNGLILLLLGPRSTVYPYVWIILPVALFLSALLEKKVRVAYLIVIGVAIFLLNATLQQVFFLYAMLPLEVIGNLILTLSLIPIFLRPSLIFEKA